MLGLAKKAFISFVNDGPRATIKKIAWVALRLTYYLPKNRFGDRIFGKLWFYYSHGRSPAKVNRLNDVLYRIKSTDEIINPLRIFVSDKEYAKLYVKAILGEQYTVPTLAVLREISEVDTFEFPPDCCIKPTQYSGIIILRRNNAPIDKNEIKDWFSLNYYDCSREANYRTLEHKVIVEPILNFDQALDYKIFCYRGMPRVIQVGLKKDGRDLRRYYDPAWKELVASRPKSETPHYERPDKLTEMLSVAATLSKPFSLIRVDLYSSGGQILVGEMTNCHWSAYDDFGGKEFEVELSKYIFMATPPEAVTTHERTSA